MNAASSSAASSYVEKGAHDRTSEALPDTPLAVCTLVVLPEKYRSSFSHLRGTQFFFFGVVRKLNRIGIFDKRVFFVTEHTINLASPQGRVSRCAKVEDIAELICDAQARAVGIRMRSRPFAIALKGSFYWDCFHEMPVDLLLHATSAAQYAALLQVVRFVYHTCTHETLPCRLRKKEELWGGLLILAPDGSRVKKRAIQHHIINPTLPEGSAAAADFGASRSQKPHRNPCAFQQQSRRTSLSAADAEVGPRSGQNVSAAVSTPRRSSSLCASPSLLICSGEVDHQTALKSSSATLGLPPAPSAAPPSTKTEAVPTFAPSRNDNPLRRTARSGKELPEKYGDLAKLRPRVCPGSIAAAPTAELPRDASAAITPCAPEEVTAEVARGRRSMKSFHAQRSQQWQRGAERHCLRCTKEREPSASVRVLNSFPSSPRASRYTSSSWSPRSFVVASSGGH
ncbi:hypothetical protein LSCM1_04510 [Leishmania martiniquensis]|uniref:Uncharacterized protein n=1 Tax=Leishmania martiniquensis TaxID=1580590 RepID=A0A836HBJ9_9TRYP|nr:hypothetical protein LSCM1_04510 [Leishmania martiniquensis]